MTDKLLIERSVLQQALDALKQADSREGYYSYNIEISALSKALAAPQPAPASSAEIDGFKTPGSWGIEAVQPADPVAWLHTAAKNFYNLTVAEPRLRLSSCDPKVRDAAKLAGEHLRAAIVTTSQPAEPVMWQYRWTNPAATEEFTAAQQEWGCPESAEWKPIEPRPGQTVEEKCAELEAYRYGGKITYEVRALYTSPPQREPLTEAQIFAIGKQLGLQCRLGGNPSIDIDYARAIEAAHSIGEKK